MPAVAHRGAPAEPNPPEPEPLRFRASDPLGTKRLEGAPSAPRSSLPSGASVLDPQRVGPGPGQPVAHLSPRMTAVFGALFGLATVASIIALLIQGVPPTHDQDIEDRAAAAAVETAAVVAEEPAPPTLESRKPKRVALPGPWRVTDLEKEKGAAIRIVKGTIDRRAFVTALQEEGVPKKEVYRILKAFEGVRSFDKTGRKDEFIVAMDGGDKRVRGFEYVVSSLEIFQAKEDDAGLLRAEQLDMKIAEGEVVAAFYIGADLERSYRWAGLEPGILDEINDALNGRLSTESFEEGGVVRLVATEVTALGLFAEYKNLVALEYRPPDPSKEPVRAYSFDGEKSKGYFDEKGRQPFTGGWRSPVPGAPITSHYNPKRMHPVLNKVMPHNGTDFGAPSGTPVYAAYRGTVDFVGNSGASGNLVLITHPNGIQTGYAHLSKFAAGISKGDKVGTHELIGYVGSTGRSTGPHLHFSAKRDGKFFDAATLRLDGVRVLPTIDRPGFLARKAELDVRLDGIPLPEPAPEPPAAKADPTAEGGDAASATLEGKTPEPGPDDSSDARPDRKEDKEDAAQEGVLRGADLAN
jgi:murein DD-endopeptidase MepM/ murein hydrolase activator NlpD